MAVGSQGQNARPVHSSGRSPRQQTVAKGPLAARGRGGSGQQGAPRVFLGGGGGAVGDTPPETLSC